MPEIQAKSKSWIALYLRDAAVNPILWLLIGYVFLLAPHAYRYLKHHPDERGYTDAALRMVQSGDYLTPHTPEGELLLIKPILTYWLVTAGYAVLGISTFSSRLPFLLVGASVIWVTYRMAWYLFGSRQTGILAALIVCCQPAILISSPRSVPDIVLTLFLTVSAFGFVRLLREPHPDWWSIALAYGGTGLAIEAKGLPAVIFCGLAMAVLLLFQPKKLIGYWRRHLAGLLLAAGIGVAWFVAMYLKHGDAILDQFFWDQVSRRVSRTLWGVLTDLPLVMSIAALSFLLWLGSLVDAAKRCFVDRRESILPIDPVIALLGGWCLVYLLLAASVSHVNVRYQSAIAPMLSAMAAGLLATLEPSRIRLWLTRLGWFAGPALAIVAIATAGLAIATGEMVVSGILSAVAACTLAVCYGIYAKRLSLPHLGVATVLTLLCISPLVYIAGSCVVGQTSEERLMACLNSLNQPQRSLCFVSKPAFASRLRVISGGEMDGLLIGTNAAALAEESPIELHQQDILVLGYEESGEVDLTGFELERVPTNGFQQLELKGLLSSLMRGELVEYLDMHREHLTVAVPLESAIPGVRRLGDIAERPEQRVLR